MHLTPAFRQHYAWKVAAMGVRLNTGIDDSARSPRDKPLAGHPAMALALPAA